jgi:hypothetical protein
MISKQDRAVGKGWLWYNNENSLVRITLPFYRRPTFGPTIFDPKTTVNRRACPFQKPSLSKAFNESQSLSLSPLFYRSDYFISLSLSRACPL